jgi:four helix bundle protein
MGSTVASKVVTFKDSLAWQACRELYSLTFEATKSFPESERYGMTSQMRRAANSAASNIAEGFGRQTKADKTHFYTMARGSVTELQSHAQLAFDVRLLDERMLARIEVQSTTAHKLIVGIIKSVEARNR